MRRFKIKRRNTMKMKTRIAAGRITANHNETLVSRVRIPTAVNTGCSTAKHNQALVGRITV
jgi:hypothetical protein